MIQLFLCVCVYCYVMLPVSSGGCVFVCLCFPGASLWGPCIRAFHYCLAAGSPNVKKDASFASENVPSNM